MRWIMTLGTVAGLAALTGILWNTEGRSLLEHLPFVEQEDLVTTDRIDIDTLVELTDPDVIESLVGTKQPQEIAQGPALTTYSSGTSHVFVGGDAEKAEVLEALWKWEQEMAMMRAAADNKPVFAGRTASSYGSTTSASARPGASANSTQNDYKYIPRMQRFGLTSTNRFGRVNAFGKRSLWDRTRFGQQQREADRLRSKYEQHVGGQTVVKNR